MPTNRPIDLEAIRHRVMDSPWWSGSHREIDYRVMHDARELLEEVDRLRVQIKAATSPANLIEPALESLERINRVLVEWTLPENGLLGRDELLTLCQTRLVLVQSIMAQMG